MSTHFIDLQVRPDPELTNNHLLGAIYSRLHLALVELSCHSIGVSFPAHDNQKPSLGAHMRLHGPQDALQNLLVTSWLKGMQDHLHVSAINAAPASASHRVVSRVQAKSNAARLRRRAIKRHGLDVEAAAQRIPDSAEERLKLPFVLLGSRSTGQTSFPLFIRHGPLLDQPSHGHFSSYGLSPTATVPWF